MRNSIVPKLSKKKKANRKKHSPVSLWKSGLEHGQFSSLLRPLVPIPIQSRESGFSECAALIQCPLHMQTQASVCAFSESTRAAKSLPLEMIRQFQEYICRENSCIGFPSGNEIMISFPRKYLSIIIIISCYDGNKSTEG